MQESDEITLEKLIHKIFVVILLLLAILYVIYHIYSGKFNFKNYLNKGNITEEKKAELNDITKEKEFLQNKVNQLKDDNIDSDLLDEELKKNTSYTKNNEIIIYTNSL